MKVFRQRTDKKAQHKTAQKKTVSEINLRQFHNSGWMTGLEPATLGTTNRCSNQLSYNHRVFFKGMQKYVFFDFYNTFFFDFGK